MHRNHVVMISKSVVGLYAEMANLDAAILFLVQLSRDRVPTCPIAFLVEPYEFLMCAIELLKL